MSAPAAVVVVDHGSRLPDANAVALEVAAALRARLPGSAVEVAHLELAPPGVAEAIERCVARGVSEVVLLPLFLAPGRHSTEDLPRLGREAEERHPGLSVRVAPPLGAHPGVVEAALERLSGSGGPRRSG